MFSKASIKYVNLTSSVLTKLKPLLLLSHLTLVRLFFLFVIDRRIYHQFRVLDDFLPLGTLDGGCNGCASKACSVIFHALLNAESR